MPIFEYRCSSCRSRFQLLVGMVAQADEERCPKCGSSDLTKLVSRFTHGRSEDDRIDRLADQLEIAGEPDSPAEMRRMMREMGKATDEDFSDEMEEMFESDMEGSDDAEEI